MLCRLLGHRLRSHKRSSFSPSATSAASVAANECSFGAASSLGVMGQSARIEERSVANRDALRGCSPVPLANGGAHVNVHIAKSPGEIRGKITKAAAM